MVGWAELGQCVLQVAVGARRLERVTKSGGEEGKATGCRCREGVQADVRSGVLVIRR